MPGIPWPSLGADKIEDVLSMLLNHLYPTSQRIDGSGGDGGRDVQLNVGEELHVFEIKSFTARLGTAQKAQIRRSLLRAATLTPTDWTLLVPIDPTPAELRWFENVLASLVPFPIRLLGKTRLETELAQRPFIARYYIEDAHREVDRLVTLYKAEKSALTGGVPDALERVEHIARQLNEIDPYYRFQITTDGASSSVVVTIPRYDRAAQERPLEINISFRFPDTEEGRQVASDFQRHVDYGTPTSIPGEFVERFDSNMPLAFGNDFVPSRMDVSPRPFTGSMTLLARAKGPDGRLAAELPIKLTSMSRGQLGGIFEGKDRTGCLSISMTYAPGQSAPFTLRFRADHPYSAFDMRVLARFLSETQSPNTFAIADEQGTEFAHAELSEPELSVGAPQLAELMDDLVLIQWAAGTTRDVGPDYTPADLASAAMAAALLRGEEVSAAWNSITLDLADDAPEEMRALFLLSDRRLQAVVAKPHIAKIGGIAYNIGRGMAFDLATVNLAPEHEEWRATGVPAGVSVRLVPGSDPTMKVRLASEEQLRALSPGMRASISDGVEESGDTRLPR